MEFDLYHKKPFLAFFNMKEVVKGKRDNIHIASQ
jgi:hypothetical protein